MQYRLVIHFALFSTVDMENQAEGHIENSFNVSKTGLTDS